MLNRRIPRLSGMRDVGERDLERNRRVSEVLGAHLKDAGFAMIDCPLIEDTELFVRKSGGELTSRLYSFVDPGGNQVSLRPEFTSSVIRYFVQQEDTLTLPVRWGYSGPVFRYEREDADGYRQFDQVGAELIGAPDVASDAYVIHLAMAGLDKVGLQEAKVQVGHLGMLTNLLSGYGLSEAARVFIVDNIQAVKDGRADAASLKQQAIEIGLLRRGHDGVAGAIEKGASLPGTRELIERVLGESMASPTGRRTPDEIIARLLRKVTEADEPGRMADALAMVGELARIEGSPASALADARRLATDHRLPVASFDVMDTLVEALVAHGVAESRLVLDFGLARGISYYSGVIFELVRASATGEISLGGGGRYDGLVNALGGGDVPALGFAYGVDQVVASTEGDSPGPSIAKATGPAGEERDATSGGL